MYFSHLWQPVVLSTFASVGRWHPWCCLQHVHLMIKPWYCYPSGCYWRKPAAIFSNFVSLLNPLIFGITEFLLKIVRSLDTFVTTFSFFFPFFFSCVGCVVYLCAWRSFFPCVAVWFTSGVGCVVFFMLVRPCAGVMFCVCVLNCGAFATARQWLPPPVSTIQWSHRRCYHRRWSTARWSPSVLPPPVAHRGPFYFI